MKFLIVLACFIALAYANHDAQTVHEYNEVNVDNFKYGFETDHGIKVDQHGALHGKDTWIVEGNYEHKTPEGHNVKVNYKADEYGYHPTVHI